MRQWRGRPLLLLLAFATACSSPERRIAEGEEPMAALQVNHPSRRYDAAFWLQQARGSTALWSIARQFCATEGSDLRAHPNCASVIAADAQLRTERRTRTVPGAPRLASA